MRRWYYIVPTDPGRTFVMFGERCVEIVGNAVIAADGDGPVADAEWLLADLARDEREWNAAMEAP